MASGERRAIDRRWASFAACVLIAVASTTLTGGHDSPAAMLVNQVLLAGSTVLAGVGAWRHRADVGRAGFLIALGVAAQWVGTIGVQVNTLFVHSEAFPSWTDALYLSNYGFLMAAVLIIVRRRRLARNVAALIDTVTVTVGVGVLTWCFVIADIAGDADVPTAARVVGALYPICDVLVFGVMIRLLFSSTSARGPALLLSGGMFCLFAGDVGFTLAVFAGADSTYADWIDSLYNLSCLMMTLALWQPDTSRLADAAPRRQERLGVLRQVTLAAGALLAPGTLLIQDLQGEHDHVLAASFGGIVLFALTLARMSLLIRDVESQSEQLRKLARTDGLTGLANRRTFDFELQRAMRETLDPERGDVDVLTVGLLDLDRFKLFNDTYGHSRGDQLLRECAAHWSDALSRLAPRAFVARYGGEEFVVIFRGEHSPAAAEILRAIMPLTPMDQTFSAGVATWDGVEPALDLINRADGRLYAAKDAGRKLVVADSPAPAQP